ATPLKIVDRPICEGLVCVATSPYYIEMTDASLLLARAILERGTDIRRLGSAALELCHLADRRSVLFFELKLSPWDYAAAWLIVEEAGGLLSTMDGDAPDLNRQHSLTAGTPAAHAEFLQLAASLKEKHGLHW
ncbi:MAG: inositol monophosphatase, partial [Lachnospiraceae bacterium]|nr:inositol monophosphatase [Lachnospiraceae bacterium]